MKSYRISNLHLAIIFAAIVGVLLVLFGIDHKKENSTSRVTTEPSTSSVQGDAKHVLKQLPDSTKSCDVVSPFAPTDTACKAVADGTSIGTAVTANSSQDTTPGATTSIPSFMKVEVVGTLGNGVAANLLKGANRDLGGTQVSHDSMLIDAVNTPIESVTTNVKDALKRGQFIIVDSSDSTESSSKVNQVMHDLGLIQIEGVTSYGVYKGPDGKERVIPLQMIADEKGVRKIDQINNVLRIKKI